MEIKDFFFNLTKSLSGILDYIMEEEFLKSELFDIFFSFINNEYSLLYLRKK